MKLAVIGSGMIVPTALEALRQVHTIEVSAIYVRPHSEERGRLLARQFGIPAVFTDYQQLLEQPQIDFVYIALANVAHYEYARQALLAGKHVIVEKPITATLEEARQLASLALERHLFLFEAVTTLHNSNMDAIVEQLPRIGRLHLVQCNYSQYSSRYDRYLNHDVAPAFDPKCAGGALMDLNVYNLNFVVRLFGKPSSSHYYANLGYNGVDTSGVVVMRYDGYTAVCAAAKDSGSPSHCTLQGERGWLRVIGTPNELSSFELCVDGKTVSYSMNKYQHRMVQEFEDFSNWFAQGDYERVRDYLNQSLMVMEVLDACRSNGNGDH